MKRNDSLAAPLPSLILAIVAALLTIPASLAVWQQREIVNEDRFVALGNEALSQPAVQEELALGLADDFAQVRDGGLESSISQLLGGSSSELTSILDLIGGRKGASAAPSSDDQSLLTTAARNVLALAPNTIATNLALAATHREVVEAMRNDVIEADGDAIVLNLNEAISQLLPAGGAVLPDTAASIEVTRDRERSSALRLVQFLDGRALWLSLLPLTVFAMGFFLAPDWRRYALQAGLALLAVGGLTALVVRFVMRDRIVDKAIDTERARDAANAVFDVFTKGLITQELIIAGVGLVLAAVGFVLLRGSDATEASEA